MTFSLQASTLIAAATLAAALLPVAVGCDGAASGLSVSPTTDRANVEEMGDALADNPAAAEDVPPESPSTTDEPKSDPPPAAPQSPVRGVADITFDTIKFEMEKSDDFQRSMITQEIEDLHGRTVRIRGYILPSFQQTGLTQFVLVRDNMECCFGPGAALYDCILVEMKPDRSTDFTVRPVAVEGTFEIQEYPGPDGRPLAIYHLDGDAVKH